MAKNIICDTCRGSGGNPCLHCEGLKRMSQCLFCGGTGEVEDPDYDENDDDELAEAVMECDDCGGEGLLPDDTGDHLCTQCKGNGIAPCPDCNGRGVVLNPNRPKPKQVSP